MRKILAVILILLFAFAFIRITTSIYENKNRTDNARVFQISENDVQSVSA